MSESACTSKSVTSDLVAVILISFHDVILVSWRFSSFSHVHTNVVVLSFCFDLYCSTVGTSTKSVRALIDMLGWLP